ncbi:hypothetical protein pEaSNUABM37_00180 [Erwinia phage pEa_SNUABM_37]|nr:hypothetical protein pEaSNUABM37_00180 [Erwinia phage pEa_SNUABM_37]QXO10650.1 hypothetical protein pEaSNUABM48_00180 [Erwinia phage pEa_SNUABM_48]
MSKEIKATTRSLADSMKAAMTMGENGVAVTAPDWYEKNLPEGLTIEQRKQFQNHDSAVMAAQAVALAETGLPVMKENAGLTQISTSLAVGADTIATDIVREYQHGKNTINGHVISSYTNNAAGTNRGELAVAVKFVRSMADDLLTGGAK